MPALAVEVSTVYALSMPKYVYVQLHGVQKPIRIQADKIAKSGTSMVITKDSVQVGHFESGNVQGWWIQDEEDGPVVV
jgi:hypothetical protein